MNHNCVFLVYLLHICRKRHTLNYTVWPTLCRLWPT